MTAKSQATKIYELLNDEPFNWTHYQIVHCFDTFIGDMPGLNSCKYLKNKQAKELWDKPAELIAIMSVRNGDFEATSAHLFFEIWPDYPDGKPQCDYVCAKLAAKKLCSYIEANREQSVKLRNKMTSVFRYEKMQVEKEWDDRMLTSYLKIKKLI